jgi:hypothetical protein
MRQLKRFSTKLQPNRGARRRAFLGAGIVAGIAFGVAACTAPVAPYQPAKVTFAEAPVWRLAADQIVIKEGPGVAPPDAAVAIRIAEPPTEIIRRWAATRLRTDSASRGTVTVLIERAEASERFLQKPRGVTAALTDNAEAEVTVAFAVVISATDSSGASTGEVRADASIVSTRNESADEDAKRQQFDRMLRDAAARLDAELNKRIPAGLAPFLQKR